MPGTDPTTSMAPAPAFAASFAPSEFSIFTAELSVLSLVLRGAEGGLPSLEAVKVRMEESLS